MHKKGSNEPFFMFGFPIDVKNSVPILNAVKVNIFKSEKVKASVRN